MAKVFNNGEAIKCPLCGQTHFNLDKEVRLQGTKRIDYVEELFTKVVNILSCTKCGYTFMMETYRNNIVKEWPEEIYIKGED